MRLIGTINVLFCAIFVESLIAQALGFVERMRMAGYPRVCLICSTYQAQS